MSYVCGMDLSVPNFPGNSLTLIDTLIQIGWSPFADGQVSFLPLGDCGKFFWHSEPAHRWETVREQLVLKDELGEAVGIVLMWKNSGVGGHFHLYRSSKEIGIAWTINRKTTRDGFTDHMWYVSRLVGKLAEVGTKIEWFKFTDIP